MRLRPPSTRAPPPQLKGPRRPCKQCRLPGTDGAGAQGPGDQPARPVPQGGPRKGAALSRPAEDPDGRGAEEAQWVKDRTKESSLGGGGRARPEAASAGRAARAPGPGRDAARAEGRGRGAWGWGPVSGPPRGQDVSGGRAGTSPRDARPAASPVPPGADGGGRLGAGSWREAVRMWAGVGPGGWEARPRLLSLIA